MYDIDRTKNNLIGTIRHAMGCRLIQSDGVKPCDCRQMKRIKRTWCYLFHWRHQRRKLGFGWFGWDCMKCGEEWIVFEDWVRNLGKDK